MKRMNPVENPPGLVGWTLGLERLTTLDRPVQALEPAVQALFGGGAKGSVLRGEWLGHAVHPVLTDVVLGTWTSATLLDLVGGAESAPSARKLIGIGLLAAGPTAWTGWAEWSVTGPREKRVGLVVDEWGTWYDSEPGKGALYQQSSLRDALVAGINLNVFNQHAERVRMAASAQTINVLQAMILTDQGKMLLTPTYHVFDMYQVHHDATSIPVEVQAPRYGTGADSLPSVHVSASRDRAGVLHVSVVNLDPLHGADVTLSLQGYTAKAFTGRVLTGPAINAKNDFDGASVEPKSLSGELTAAGAKVSVPSKSVVVLTLQ